MAKAISNRNVLDAKFDIADFSGKWLEAFGKGTDVKQVIRFENDK